MLPCALLFIFAWNAVIEYRSGILGKPFATLGDEVNTIAQKNKHAQKIHDCSRQFQR